MKYFKVTNINDPEEEFYVSSTLPDETPVHLAMTLHLDFENKYQIVEVSQEEFESNDVCDEEEDDDYTY